MSDLRRGLNDWAASHGTHVAEHLRHGDSESRVRGQAARRRRTRALGGATVAVVAVVGVAWAATALPFTEAPDITPAAQVTLELSEVPDALSCGQPWTLEQGEAQHGTEDGGTVRGEWQVTADNGTIERDPQELSVGFEALEWYQRSEGAPVEAAMMVTVLTAVKDGVIVGVNPAGGASVEQGDDQGATDFNQWAPLPGACGAETRVAEDGTYDFHVVQQLQDANGRPIATWVDPAGPITLELTGLTDWYASQPHSTPTQTPDPGGDTYTAYAVERPEPRTGCDPLQALRDQGEPTADRLTYQVTIPGVQPVVTDDGERGPLVIADETVADAWYFSEPAWLVFDNPGSTHEPSMEWDSEQFTLEWGDELLNSPGEIDCAITLEYAPPSGGIWLVIDGVDAQTLGEAYPTMDFATDTIMTWIYLGEVQEGQAQ